jgi:hypothetical protein
MKFLLIMLACFVGGAVAASEVAVRTTFEAVEPNECTDEEFNIALRTMVTRSLRSRELYGAWYCSIVCRDFRKGWW